MTDYTDEEIQDLTYRVNLLKDQLQKGKIHFAPHLVDGFKHSFNKIQFSAKGEVFPETVDSRIRSMTIGLAHMKYRTDIKDQISLKEIQEAYFKILEDNLGHHYKQMTKANSNPNDVAHFLSRDSKFAVPFAASLTDFKDYIVEFWTSLGEAGSFHLEDDNSIKAVFGGDLFPSYTQNIASTSGLYLDTIILPCPIIKCASLLEFWSAQEQTFYILKHCLNTLSYKELALSLDIPIVAILPDLSFFEDDHKKFLMDISEPAALKHLSCIFNYQFENIEHVIDFTKDLNTPKSFAEKVANKKYLLFDTEWTGSLEEQISQNIHEQKSVFDTVYNKNLPKFLVTQCYGRMAQANDIILRSNLFRATPLIEAETSWKYFNWKLKYDSKSTNIPTEQKTHFHVTRALQQCSSTDLTWLGNISPKDLIKIRKHEDSEEIRNILTGGLKDLININENNFFRTTDQVFDNITKALEKHQKILRELRDKKLKFFGIDVASSLAVGGISIAAACCGNTLAVAAAGLGWSGLTKNPKKLIGEYKAMKSKNKEVENSATGLFFKHAPKS